MFEFIGRAYLGLLGHEGEPVVAGVVASITFGLLFWAWGLESYRKHQG